MQKTASISNVTWDLLLYLSYVDISWQLKISTLHQRSTACSPLPYLAHTILFLGHFWPIYILFQFFGLEQSSSLSDFTLAGEQVCNKDLSTLRQEYLNHSDEDFSRYCFSSAYIVALLHDGLGVPLDDKRQAYQNTIILLQWNLPLTNLLWLLLTIFSEQDQVFKSGRRHSGWMGPRSVHYEHEKYNSRVIRCPCKKGT
jgi:hypothetical protein